MGEDERAVTNEETQAAPAGAPAGERAEGTPSTGTTGAARTQHVIHLRPHDDEALVQAIAPALGRLDPATAETQLLIITADADTALELAARAGAVIPITGSRRGSRVLRTHPAAAVAGSVGDLRALVRESALKLESVRAVVIAWADDLEAAGQLEALDALLGEVPRDAARVLVTGAMSETLEALAERQLWKARRLGDELETSPVPMPVQYLVVTPSARPSALARVLDEIDPPSAVVLARTDRTLEEARAVARALGHGEGDALLRVTRGEVEPNVALVILYDAPTTEQELATVGAASPAQVVAFVRPRQLEVLRRLTGGAVTPLPATSVLSKARARAERTRAELRATLAEGLSAREAIVLDPLLEEFDGVELAAAALVLLERERARRVAQPAPAVATPASAAAAPGGAWPRVFLTVGERDGARAGDIVGAVSGESKITSDKIGRIEIRDTHTLVELAPEVADQVVRAMNGATVKGRKVVARLDQRTGADSGQRERRGPPRGAPGRGAPRGGGDRPFRPRRDEGGPRGGARGGPRGERPARGRRDDGERDAGRSPKAMREREEWSERAERVRHARRPRPGEDVARRDEGAPNGGGDEA